MCVRRTSSRLGICRVRLTFRFTGSWRAFRGLGGLPRSSPIAAAPIVYCRMKRLRRCASAASRRDGWKMVFRSGGLPAYRSTLATLESSHHPGCRGIFSTLGAFGRLIVKLQRVADVAFGVEGHAPRHPCDLLSPDLLSLGTRGAA